MLIQSALYMKFRVKYYLLGATRYGGILVALGNVLKSIFHRYDESHLNLSFIRVSINIGLNSSGVLSSRISSTAVSWLSTNSSCPTISLEKGSSFQELK